MFSFLKRKRFIVYGLVILFNLVVLDRFLRSIYFFSSGGGWEIRKELFEIAFSLIKRFPLLGVGNVNFIPVAHASFPEGVMSYFPETVHNFFIMLFV